MCNPILLSCKFSNKTAIINSLPITFINYLQFYPLLPQIIGKPICFRSI